MSIEINSAGRQSDKFTLRFDEGSDQRSKLKNRAVQNRRSMNSEILALIGAGIDATDGKPQAAHAIRTNTTEGAA